MRKPIESSPQFNEYKSFNKVADKLMKKWPDLFEKPGKAREITMRSLGAKIGELDRGKTTWWFNRKHETDCLIELLGIDRDELGLNQKTGRHIFALSAFPDFPPLDLMRENYWSIATPELMSEDRLEENDRFATRTKPTLDAWLSPQGNIYSGKKVEWLYVPDMTEYQLLTRKLDAIGRHHFASHNSLHEVIAKDIELVRNQQPLILAIHGNSQGDHLAALISYRQGAPLLVISPSPLPDLWQKEENKTAQPPENAGKTMIAPRDINTWIWTLLPDWRDQLSQWLEQRMSKLGIDTIFTSEATRDLLHKFDPSGKWFVGVEDVLVLCQAVSERREVKLKASAGSDGDVNLLLSLLFNRDKSSLGLIQPLIERRWKRWDLAWEGELDQEIWSDMAGDLCQFDTMLTQQLIVQGSKGFDFQRPILIRLLLRSQLMATLNKGDLADWAPACFDARRRPLVDAALDAIEIDQLEQIAAQLIEAPASAETMGAGEALFTAIGRRIIREEDIGGELPMLADHVLKQLTWDNELLYPCSRPLANMAQQLEWICVCWAWSLGPCRSTDLPPNWFFPGWYPELSQTLPKWIDNYASSSSSRHWEHMAIPMRDFLSVVTRWLARHETPPAYENMPLLFNAGLLARAAAGQWPASSDWWWGLLDHPIAEQTLKRQVDSADPSVNRRTALAWWPSLVKHQRQKFSNMFTSNPFVGSSLFTRNRKEQGYSILLSWVMEQMDKHGEQALTGLDDDDRKFLLLHPAALSTPVKRQLLRSLAKEFPKDWHAFQFANLFLHYGPETAVEMEMFLDNKELGDQAAGYLWEWAPRKAEFLLRKKRNSSREALRRLILASPFSAIGDAVDLLRDDPALLSDKERRDWARWRLPDARQHAQDLMQLLNTKTEE